MAIGVAMTSRYESMFKAYDVRGMIPDIDEGLFYWSGRAFVEKILIPEQITTEVYVSFDTRLYSQKFANYVAKGIEDAGGTPLFIGMASTEMLYAACVESGKPGIQLTASHNPRDYHGMKIVKKAPQMVGLKSGLDKIRDVVLEHEGEALKFSEEPRYSVNYALRSNMETFLKNKIMVVGKTSAIHETIQKLGKKITIVADAGNGAGGIFMPYLQELYPDVTFVPLYWEPDGNFPNHPADPQNYENLKALQAAIKQHKADFGVAFDGDADRAVLVDEKGEVVDGDFLVSAFAANLLEEYKKNEDWQSRFNPVIATIQPNSRCVWETIGEHDGVAATCKQGHIYVKEAMAQYNGLYGGEYSNHHYFGELLGMDSGAFPVALFLKMYVEQGANKASKMFERWNKRYFVTELMNLEIPKGQSWEDWKAKLVQSFKDGVISYLDGVSVYYPEWKFSMRASNTEPVVRFILETRGSDTRDKMVAKIKKVIGI